MVNLSYRISTPGFIGIVELDPIAKSTRACVRVTRWIEMVGSGTRKPRSARIEHNQFLLLVWRNVANWSISLPRYTPTFVQSQAAALDFLEKSTVPWKPSSSFFFLDRQKKSFEDRDNHFAPRNCTANYDAFYVDPIRLELWLELPSSKRFTKRTLLKSLFPWLPFFKILFMEFQIRRRRKRRNKRFQKRRHNVRHNLSFFPFDGAMENGSRRKEEN